MTSYKKEIIKESRPGIVHDLEEILAENQWLVFRWSELTFELSRHGVRRGARLVKRGLETLGWENKELRFREGERIRREGSVWVKTNSCWGTATAKEIYWKVEEGPVKVIIEDLKIV
jgi:hypothetical protein